MVPLPIVILAIVVLIGPYAVILRHIAKSHVARRTDD